MGQLPKFNTENEDLSIYTGTARHTMIGHGLCRGPDWQNGQWPHDEGFETLDQCSLECGKRPGCTGIFL